MKKKRAVGGVRCFFDKKTIIALCVVVACVSVIVAANVTGRATMVDADTLDINDVIDALRASPDYFEMSSYVNCAYSETFMTAEEAEEMAKASPAIYGGIGSDVYRIVFTCRGESTSMLVLYEPFGSSVVRTFIVNNMVL